MKLCNKKRFQQHRSLANAVSGAQAIAFNATLHKQQHTYEHRENELSTVAAA